MEWEEPPRQHPVLPTDGWEPPAGHWLLLLWCRATVGPPPKGLPPCKCPAHSQAGLMDAKVCIWEWCSGEGGGKL